MHHPEPMLKIHPVQADVARCGWSDCLNVCGQCGVTCRLLLAIPAEGK